MTRRHGASRAATGPRGRRLDQVEDINDWLDAVGDELAEEFPDLIYEPSSDTGSPFGERGANERGTVVRDPGPDFTKKRWSPGAWHHMAIRCRVRGRLGDRVGRPRMNRLTRGSRLLPIGALALRGCGNTTEPPAPRPAAVAVTPSHAEIPALGQTVPRRGDAKPNGAPP